MIDAVALKSLIRSDRVRAHEELFRGWHENPSCEAHKDLLDALWSEEQRLVILGFRGFGKSTLTEEMVTIATGEFAFRCCLFIGPSEERAAEHLIAVKTELKQNEQFLQIYGDQFETDGADTQTYVQLKGRRSILAMGCGQKIRGLKKSQARPDLVIVDDFEDEDNVLTVEGRRRMVFWMQRTLRRACHPQAKYRVEATVMHPECVPLQLAKLAGWKIRRYPVTYRDEQGHERSTWAARFPMSLIERDREEARQLGDAVGWALEMECDETAAQEAGSFNSSHIRVVPQERTWQAVYAMYDPARTIGPRSSTTGKAVWSWIGCKLVVWASGAERWLPEQIVSDIFDVAEVFDPVWVGFEEDGLNEWGRALIRDEERRRRVALAYRGIKAPRDKRQFILALEKYFSAGEVEFACEMPELRAQLLGFPRPPIDAPNALAYALLLRPGHPIYDNFRDEHVAVNLAPVLYRPFYIAVNAKDGWVTAALMQIFEGQIRILADWCLDGLPEERVAGIQVEAQMAAAGARTVQRTPQPRGWDALKMPFDPRDPPLIAVKGAPVWLVPGWHYDRWLNVGLLQAINHIPGSSRRGGEAQAGREVLREALARMEYGESAVQVAENAHWTLRALAGGYCRGRNGIDPETGPYAVLLGGLEAALGVAAISVEDEEEEIEPNWAFDRQGRRYRSIMPAKTRVH